MNTADEGLLFRWGGLVLNESPSMAFRNVWLTVHFLDADGRVLIEDGDWLEYVGPGQSIGIGQQWGDDEPEGVVEARGRIDSFDPVAASVPFPSIEIEEVEADDRGRHTITGWLLNETGIEYEVNQVIFLLLDADGRTLSSVREDFTGVTVLPRGETYLQVEDRDPWPDGVTTVIGYVQEATGN